MSDVNTWSTTAGSNNSAAPDGWPENMNYSDVNNAARENMAAAARLYADMNGTLDSAGSANAYTLTPNRTIASYADGMSFVFKANHTNSGASTLNVSAVGATDIRTPDGSALSSGSIVQDRYYQVQHDGTYWVLFPRYSVEVATLTGTETLTNKTLTAPSVSDITITGAIIEEVYNLTGTALDPANGTIQQKTLSGNTTLTDSLATGESIILMIDDGTAYTITWPTMQWIGGIAPTLATTGYTVVVLWKDGSTLYGSNAGDLS